jgi:hypothetical protein
MSRSSRSIHIYKISRNYTRCEIWWGSPTFHNKLGSTIITPNKGLTRKQRYDVIAGELSKQTNNPAPSYRPNKTRDGLRRKLESLAAAKKAA